MILICFAALAGCRNEISEIKALTDPQNLPVQTNINAEYYYTVHGKLRNKLTAGQLDQYGGEKGYIQASKGLELFIYDSLQQETAHLTAENGKFLEKEERLIAWGKVVLINAQGSKLETEELTFLQDSASIYTDKFVTITTPSGIIHGKGLESNDSFTKYRIIETTGNLYMNNSPDQP
jgi:LPS export ABC transporter protein LptC